MRRTLGVIAAVVLLGVLIWAGANRAGWPGQTCADREALDAARHFTCAWVLEAPGASTTDLAEAHNFRGIEFNDRGLYLQAMNEYREAARLDPKMVWAISNQGTIYNRWKQHEQALELFQQAVTLYRAMGPAAQAQPLFHAIFRNRALTYRALGDYERSLDDYDQVIRLKDYACARMDRAWTREKIGDLAGAFDDSTEAFRQNPTMAGAVDQRGRLLLTVRKFHAALADFKRALAVDPEYVDAMIHRGEVRAWLGDRNGAIGDETAAIKMSGGSELSAYFIRSMAWLAKGDTRRAQEDMDELLARDPAGAATWQASARNPLKLSLYMSPTGDEEPMMSVSEQKFFAEAMAKRDSDPSGAIDAYGSVVLIGGQLAMEARKRRAEIWKEQGRTSRAEDELATVRRLKAIARTESPEPTSGCAK